MARKQLRAGQEQHAAVLHDAEAPRAPPGMARKPDKMLVSAIAASMKCRRHFWLPAAAPSSRPRSRLASMGAAHHVSLTLTFI